MARGIDDVDLIVFIMDSGILGENGDAALAFEIAGVHHTVDDRLVFAVHAALLEHLIDQRGLAVVNVRDDCNIPNFILRHTWRPFLLCLKVSYIKISQKRILTQTYWKYKIFLRENRANLPFPCGIFCETAQSGPAAHTMGRRREIPCNHSQNNRRSGSGAA